MSQLDDHPQTREYEKTEIKSAMKAVMSALQDEGYVINTAEMELGIVTAALELFEEDKNTKAYNEFWYGAGQGTYQTTKRMEVSSLVSQHGEKTRVRINIIAKALTNTGGSIWSQPVYDAQIYQSIFTKIDKSIYLEKEKI